MTILSVPTGVFCHCVLSFCHCGLDPQFRKIQHMSYYIYIMSNKPNGVLYVGVTNDLIRRVYEHRNHLVKGFTARYNLEMLVWFEQTDDVNSAIAREKQLKNWHRQWKIELIVQLNPNWRDLYESIIG